MGLYIASVSGPCGSVTNKFTFCPRLSNLVNDSPQPKIFSLGDNEKTGLISRLLSIPFLIKLKGKIFTCDESLSAQRQVSVNRLPLASINTIRNGFSSINNLPNALV